MKSLTIHFVRHAATEANVTGRYIGSTDLPLSDTGKQEISNMTKIYQYPNAQVLYSSPLKRCIETSKILYPDKDAIIIDGFREYDFGEWEAKTANELKDDETFKKWIINVKSATPPKGEKAEEFSWRISSTFSKLVKGMINASIESAIIVSHAGVIMTLMTKYGIPKCAFYDWMMSSGCGFSVRTNISMWMRDNAFEVFSKIPFGNLELQNRESKAIKNIAKNIYGGLKD